MTIPAKSKIQELQKLIEGLPKVAPKMVVPLRGQSTTTAELVAMLQSLVDAAQAVMTARAAWKETLHNLAKAEAEVGPVVSRVRQMLQTLLDGCAPELTTLGLPLKKPRKPLSPEASALRAAKARSTREARGTRSKKQKALSDFHGPGEGLIQLQAVA